METAMTPFDFWAAAWRNTISLSQTGARYAETAKASQTVIDSRTATMRSAMANPIAADYGELARMAPEKMFAFSQAGMAAFGDVLRWQMEAWAQWQQMAGIMMSGRIPTIGQFEGMASRSMRMATRSASAGRKALAPIHKTATGNARRLSRRKPA
jgi:hypothetical protein